MAGSVIPGGMRIIMGQVGRERWSYSSFVALAVFSLAGSGWGCSGGAEAAQAGEDGERAKTPPASTSAGAGALGRAGESFAGGELDLNTLGYDQGHPDAPLKVIEITDFGCGYCRRFNQEVFPVLLEEFVETGRVQWKFVPYVLGMFPNGDQAALAGECAGSQGPQAFYRIRDRLFHDQAGWRASEDPTEFFVGLAREEELDVHAFRGCLSDDATAQRVELNNRLGRALGVRGTPLFIVGGIPVTGAQPVEQFRGIFESILATGDAFAPVWLPHPPTPGGPSVTRRVVEGGLGYSLGPENAPLHVVEFSDFGCGYCRVFQEETRPTLLEEYVDTGLVRWTYVPFVLGIFPNGQEAAVAGECAGLQGHFDPMRARLYRDQAGWREESDPAAYFTRIASEEGLDPTRFSRCLSGEDAVRRVWEGVQLGRMSGVRGAPAFLVDGFLVSGAKPLDTFRDLLDLKLSSRSAGQ